MSTPEPGQGDPPDPAARPSYGVRRSKLVAELARRFALTTPELEQDFADHGISIPADGNLAELISLRARIAWADENWPT